jgi:hypothetical protein
MGGVSSKGLWDLTGPLNDCFLAHDVSGLPYHTLLPGYIIRDPKQWGCLILTRNSRILSQNFLIRELPWVLHYSVVILTIVL